MEEKDRAFIKALVKILDEGTFKLKRKEVLPFHAVMQWVDALENRIKEKKLPEPVIEPLPERKKRARKK